MLVCVCCKCRNVDNMQILLIIVWIFFPREVKLNLVTDSFHAKTWIVWSWEEWCGIQVCIWHETMTMWQYHSILEYWWQSDIMRHDHRITLAPGTHQANTDGSHAPLTHCCGQVSGMEPGTRHDQLTLPLDSWQSRHLARIC